MMHWIDWRRWLVYTHRWLGIVGGLLFVAWFVSGIVMMYARMPGMASEERLARAPALDLSTATVSPLDAARAVGLVSDDPGALAELTRPGTETTAQKLAADISIERVRVGMFGDRPIYRFGAGRNETIVFADTPAVLETVGRAEAEAIARRYAPDYAGPWRYDGYLTEPDQWTLQSLGLMPIHRFALDDEDATRLYVSSVTGDVVLSTTRSELGVFHATSPEWLGVERIHHLVVAHRLRHVYYRPGVGLMAIFADEPIPPETCAVAVAVRRPHEVAPLYGPHLWGDHADVDVQRPPVDGAVQLVFIARHHRTAA